MFPIAVDLLLPGSLYSEFSAGCRHDKRPISSMCICHHQFELQRKCGGKWTSTNTAVATVNQTTGAVTGVAQGTTTIIYTVGDPALCGTSSATYQVTVNPVPYAGTLSNASLCAGLSTTLPVNGSVGGTWHSSNAGVATVDASSGVITGLREESRRSVIPFQPLLVDQQPLLRP